MWPHYPNVLMFKFIVRAQQQRLYLLLLQGALCIYASATDHLSYEIEQTYPHNPLLFTQGLAIDAGFLYESSGLYGQSALYRYHWPSLELEQTIRLPPNLFAEGIAIIKQELLQLTWQEQLLLRYQLPQLSTKESLSYHGEGWGLTADGAALYMTDGSGCITKRSMNDFNIIKRFCIDQAQRYGWRLNDLAYQAGFLYIQVYGQDLLLKVDASNGKLIAQADLSKLRQQIADSPNAGVCNGITRIDDNRLLITGKYWPLFFVIRWQ